MAPQEPVVASTRYRGVIGALTALSFEVMRCFEGIAAEHNVSLIQARLLVGLLDRHPTMSEAARMLYLERSSMTGLVIRAEAHGLVARERIGGQTYIGLTPNGRAMGEAMDRRVMERISERCEALTACERRMLDEFIGRMITRRWPEPDDR